MQKIMTVVSSKEFVTNQEKYFELALNEQIFIQNGKNLFVVSIANEYEDDYLEPDDDLQRAITIEDLRGRMHKRIHELFANK
jgi:hypothetical protein